MTPVPGLEARKGAVEMKFGGSREERPKPGEISGFIGEGVEIEGDIQFKDTLRVDGHLRATIRGDGELVVGPTGQVEGDLTVGALCVSGRVKGTLRVKDKLEVHAGGRVEGEVLLGRPGLVVHDGGVVEAKVQMGTLKESEETSTSAARVPAGHPSTLTGAV